MHELIAKIVAMLNDPSVPMSQINALWDAAVLSA